MNTTGDNCFMAKIEGHKGGHYIAGVQTEEGNHKDKKRWLKGKKRPDLDAMEAGDPDGNAIDWSTEFLTKINKKHP